MQTQSSFDHCQPIYWILVGAVLGDQLAKVHLSSLAHWIFILGIRLITAAEVNASVGPADVL